MPQATTSDAFLLGLESLMRRSGQGPHLAATVLELDGAADPEKIRAAAKALAHRHPLLHAHLRRSPLTFIAEWLTGTGPAIPVTFHEEQSLIPLVSRLINAGSIDIFKPGPNIELHVLQGANQHTLILLWPHSLFDGIGMDKLVAELDSTDTTRREDWGETNPASGSVSELWKAAHPMIEEMRTFPAANAPSLHRRGQAPGAAAFEVLAFKHDSTQSIRAKMAGTVGELLLIPYFAALSARATAAVIAHRSGSQPNILLSLPIQRVIDPAKRPLFHNHMTPWSLLLEAEPLADLTSATKSLFRSYGSFRKRKLNTAMEALTKLNERCPSRFYLLPIKHYLKGEICSLFHSHTGEFAKGTTRLFSHDILNAYHVPSVSTPPGIGIFFSEKNGRLTCTLSWREGSLDAEELDILRHQLLTDLGAENPASK